MADQGKFKQLCDRAHREPPRIALVLGSGLAELAGCVRPLEQVRFSEVPSLEQPTVPGHEGKLILGTWGGQTVLLFSGRLHFYEGHPWSKVMQPIMIARDLGARYLLLTNAAGGIREDLVPGKLLAVNGHIDWTQGYRGDRGPTRNPHDQRLNSLLLEAGRDLGMNLPTGLYAQVTGPCYETPAEIRALKSLGVDAVGMSTAREVVAGFELGLTCAALSCITNRAAGLGPGLICHDDVLASTLESRDRMAGLLECFLRRL